MQRVLTLCGGEQVAADPRFQTAQGRVEHIEEVDGIVADWIAQRPLSEVLEQFEQAEAAIGPAYDIEQIFSDPQYAARNDLVAVPDDQLGVVKMANAFPFLSETPGAVRFAGPSLGSSNREVFVDQLGLSPEELEELKTAGVI